MVVHPHEWTICDGNRKCGVDAAPQMTPTGCMLPDRRPGCQDEPVTTNGARVEWLTIAGDVENWRSIGLTVQADGTIPLMGTSLRIDEPSGAVGSTGIIGWALSGVEPTEAIVGLPTAVVDPGPPVIAQHALGAIELDHVVVMTSDLGAVSAAMAEATGCELKRTRELGTITQGFHRIGRGGLIVEIVEHPDFDRGEAEFWGIVIIVDDLDAACDLLGDERISEPKDAVQPGRRIATIRKDVGLGTAVALMSRDVR